MWYCALYGQNNVSTGVYIAVSLLVRELSYVEDQKGRTSLPLTTFWRWSGGRYCCVVRWGAMFVQSKQYEWVV